MDLLVVPAAKASYDHRQEILMESRETPQEVTSWKRENSERREWRRDPSVG